MDIPTISIDGLDAVATRLDRCAEHIVVQSALIHAGTSEAWRGGAADRHRELVARHAADLTELARRLREAATAVRHLGSIARQRAVALGHRTVGLAP
ncbi:MAG: hypothetical protein ACTMHL_01830 [Janibacter sp.]